MIKMCIFLLRYPVEWWNLHAGHEHGQSVCNHGIRSGIVSAILLGQKFYACNCSIAWNICLKSLFSSITRNIIQKNKHSHHRLGFDTYHPSSYTISVIGVQKFKYTTFSERRFIFYQLFIFSITSNLLGNQGLDYELLSGVKTARIGNMLNAEQVKTIATFRDFMQLIVNQNIPLELLGYQQHQPDQR